MRPIPPLTLLNITLRCDDDHNLTFIQHTAITKPPNLSSAQVLRDLQHAFKSSRTFQPLLDATEKQNADEKHRSKRRRIDSDNVFKMGHGGTLDPMATGVLIVGIGRGTKSLQDFLYCTKTYETVVLFGKSTDSYDVAGKIVASKPTTHITREMVEEKLTAFRGKIKQVPPIYSALKINGMKAYEYARSGKELPRQLEAREMEVSECQLLDWYEPGKHEYRWPAEEAPEEDKNAFQKLVKVGQPDSSSQADSVSEPQPKQGNKDSSEKTSTDDVRNVERGGGSPPREEKAILHTHTISGLSEQVADAPAARVRLTVSSGFYVRSFAHDLGLACDSYGTMSELARTRQADFTTLSPVADGLVPALEYADIDKGEEVWGPKITKVLEDWLAKPSVQGSTGSHQQKSSIRNFQSSDRRGRQDPRKDSRSSRPKRRNSSSPEL